MFLAEEGDYGMDYIVWWDMCFILGCSYRSKAFQHSL